MGCWNETCAISRLPIAAGEKVKMIVLEQMKNREPGKTFCYATDGFSPFCFPISGEYDDYGGIEGVDLKSFEVKIFLETIHDRIVPVEQGANQYHERAIPATPTWRQLMDGFQDGRVKVTHRYHSAPGPNEYVLAKVLVKESVWNEVSKSGYQSWKKFLTAQSTEENLLTWLKNGVEGAEKLKIAKTKVELTGTDEAKELLAVLKMDIFEQENLRDIVPSFSHHVSFSVTQALKFAMKHLKEGTVTLEDQGLKNIMRSSAELAMVLFHMDITRNAWSLTSGSGSQDSEYLRHTEWFLKFANIAIEASNKSWDGFTEEDFQEHVADHTRLEYQKIHKLLTTLAASIPPALLVPVKPKAKRKTRKQ